MRESTGESDAIDRLCLDAVGDAQRSLAALRDLLTGDCADSVVTAVDAVTVARAAHSRLGQAVGLLIERAAGRHATWESLGIPQP